MMSPLSCVTKASGRMCLMLLWLYQALILWCLAYGFQVEWAYSCGFELIADFRFGGNSQILFLCHAERRIVRVLPTLTLFVSLHFIPHAFAVSFRLQITSSFSTSISASSALSAASPTHQSCVTPMGRDGIRRCHFGAPYPTCLWEVHGWAAQDPGTAPCTGDVLCAFFYPWSSMVLISPHLRSWDFSP